MLRLPRPAGRVGGDSMRTPLCLRKVLFRIGTVPSVPEASGALPQDLWVSFQSQRGAGKDRSQQGFRAPSFAHGLRNGPVVIDAIIFRMLSAESATFFYVYMLDESFPPVLHFYVAGRVPLRCFFSSGSPLLKFLSSSFFALLHGGLC